MTQGAALEQLDSRRRRFVEAYCSGMNGAEAAKYAGSEGNSTKVLSIQAGRWKKDPLVQAAIMEIRSRDSEATDKLRLKAFTVLEGIIDDPEADPRVRVQACKVASQVFGFAEIQRHAHLHAHVHDGGPEKEDVPDADEAFRFVRLELASGRYELRCACCRETYNGSEGSVRAAAGNGAPG